MDWFRVYHDIIDDPKILALDVAYRWFYIALMSVCSRSNPRGNLPDRKSIAIHLRLRQDHSDRVVDAFIRDGLIEEDVNTKGLSIHGWHKRQCKSDDSYARVKRFRNGEGNVSETAPHACASDTEQIQNRGREDSLPPTLVLSEEFTRLGFLAEELGSDPSYAVWVGHSARLGFPADWIDAALRRCPKAKFSVDYLSGILRGYQREGGPPKAAPNGKGCETPKPELKALTTEEDEAIKQRKRQQWGSRAGGRK